MSSPCLVGLAAEVNKTVKLSKLRPRSFHTSLYETTFP